MSAKPVRRHSMELSRGNMAHFVRIIRNENRLTNQVYEDTPFGSPVKIIQFIDDYKFNRDSIKVSCGDVYYIYERKELAQWK